jgi:hypothetical protein
MEKAVTIGRCRWSDISRCRACSRLEEEKVDRSIGWERAIMQAY